MVCTPTIRPTRLSTSVILQLALALVLIPASGALVADDDAGTPLSPGAKRILATYQEGIIKADAAFRDAVAKEQAKAIKAFEAELQVQTHRADLEQCEAITATIESMKKGGENPPSLNPHWEARRSTTVYRYIGEYPDHLFAADDATAPDELTVSTQGRVVTITGTKKGGTQEVGGKLTGHFGKAFRTTLTNVECTVEIKQPSQAGNNHTNYEFLVMNTDGTAESTLMALKVGTAYLLTVTNDGSKTTWSFDDGKTATLLKMKKTSTISGWGMASTVRMPGDCSELVATLTPR